MFDFLDLTAKELPGWLLLLLALGWWVRQEHAEKNGGNRLHRTFEKHIEKQEQHHREILSVLRQQPKAYLDEVKIHYPVEEERLQRNAIRDMNGALQRIEAKLESSGG